VTIIIASPRTIWPHQLQPIINKQQQIIVSLMALYSSYIITYQRVIIQCRHHTTPFVGTRSYYSIVHVLYM
jgi:hypothetical protein